MTKRIKHLKRGTTYSIVSESVQVHLIGDVDEDSLYDMDKVKVLYIDEKGATHLVWAKVQTDAPLKKPWKDMILYQADKPDGSYWLRHKTEINDPNRFEII